VAIIRKGAYEWTIEEWGAGQNSRTPPGQLPANQHAVINNLYVDEQTLKLRHGSTAVPTDGPIGASTCLLYTSPSPRDATLSRMPSSA